MKKLLALIVLCFTLVGCTSSTQYGECIGVADDKEPNLKYNVSGWNVAMAVVFFETIVVPIVVLSSEIQCPVARRISK